MPKDLLKRENVRIGFMRKLKEKKEDELINNRKMHYI
jgi:hypothetical protein